MAKKQKEVRDPGQEAGQVIDLKSDKKKNKKKKGAKLKVVMYLIIILLIAGFVAAYFLNLFSLRQTILDVLIVGDQQYAAKMIEVDNEKEKARGEQSLAQDAKTAYDKQLNDLNGREQQIAAKEQQIEERLKAVIANTENGGNTRESAIAMFETMDATSAAETLQAMNDVDAVAGILGAMKKKSSAAIMGAFDKDFAALVAARMLV